GPTRPAAAGRPGGEEPRVRVGAPRSRAPCTRASENAAPRAQANAETANTPTTRPWSRSPALETKRTRLYGRAAASRAPRRAPGGVTFLPPSILASDRAPVGASRFVPRRRRSRR